MTVTDACVMVVQLTRELSMARLLLQECLTLAHQQHVELQRTRKAYYDLLDEARELRRAARTAA
jgi:hypothetical protein